MSHRLGSSDTMQPQHQQTSSQPAITIPMKSKHCSLPAVISSLTTTPSESACPQYRTRFLHHKPVISLQERVLRLLMSGVPASESIRELQEVLGPLRNKLWIQEIFILFRKRVKNHWFHCNHTCTYRFRSLKLNPK